jgi:hypothetical protein
MGRKYEDKQHHSNHRGPRGNVGGRRVGDVDGRVRHRDHRGGGIRRDSVYGRDRRLHRHGVDQHHRPRAQHQGLDDDAGAATVEAAIGVATLVTVLVLCLAGITAMSMQLRCIDAAREAARLAARGDERSAAAAARGIAPGGATVELRRDGEFVVATVTARANLLPLLRIAATGAAVVEPTR